MQADPQAQAEAEKKKREQEFNTWIQSNQQFKDLLGSINDQFTQQQAGERPGQVMVKQSENEKKAGVLPPGYEGTRDNKTGQLLDQYKTNPYGGESLMALKGQAFAEGLSPWAKTQMDMQKMQEQDASGKAGRQNSAATSGAMSQLARTSGVNSGAAALLARQGARDLNTARQDVSRSGTANRLNIQSQDIDRKKDLMGTFANLETQANQQNVGQAESDINRRAMFDMERYRQQMQAWGAAESASATRAAGGGGGKK